MHFSEVAYFFEQNGDNRSIYVKVGFWLQDLTCLEAAAPCQSSVSQSRSCLCLNQQIRLTSNSPFTHRYLAILASLLILTGNFLKNWEARQGLVTRGCARASEICSEQGDRFSLNRRISNKQNDFLSVSVIRCAQRVLNESVKSPVNENGCA